MLGFTLLLCVDAWFISEKKGRGGKGSLGDLQKCFQIFSWKFKRNLLNAILDRGGGVFAYLFFHFVIGDLH